MQMPPILSVKLFNSLVPITTYGSEVWFPLINQTLKDSIDKSKLKFMESVLRVKQQTSTLSVLDEVGEYHLSISMTIRVVKFWLKLKQMPDSHIVKRVYKNLVNLHDIGHNNWVTGVTVVLKDINSNICENLNTLNHNLDRLLENVLKLYTEVNDLSKFLTV